MSSEVRIKPCPFCGSHTLEICRTNDEACWIACDKCGARSDCHSDRAGAIRIWNGRVVDDGKPTSVSFDQDYEHWEWLGRRYAYSRMEVMSSEAD